MIDGKFDVVFRGQIVKSFELEEVKQNLAKLFKSNPQAIERLFSGGEAVIRRDLEYSAAMKYQSALKNAGALALIKEVEVAPEEAKRDAPAANQTEGAVQKSQREASSFEQRAKAADAGEKAVPSAAEVDSQESSADNEAAEGDLSMAEPGARLLPPKTFEKREVDTSELSLAGVGERIMPEKEPEKHQPPSIDHLKLED